MEVQIYFDIITNDGVTICVGATATLSGSYKPATFHHDIEDDREINVTEVNLANEDGHEIQSEKLTEMVYKNINDKSLTIYKEAEYGNNFIYLDDFKSEKNYTDII
jgi:hypothetical protein